MPAFSVASTLARPQLAMATTALLLVGSGTAWAAGDQGLARDVAELIDSAVGVARHAGAQVRDWIEVGYRRRPVVMIGLGGILLLPPLAVAGLALYRRRPQPPTASAISAAPMPRLASVWVEVDGANRMELPSGRDILQIGRQDDNDICLDDEDVHRYHAVIERTADCGFTITDVSGPEGNGVRVNGERCLTARLAIGDTVELGHSKLRFATAL